MVAMSTAAPDAAQVTRVGWWLSLEPLGQDAVWALTRVVNGQPPQGPVDAGLLPDIGFVKDLVGSALPVGDRRHPWTGPLTDRQKERHLATTAGRVLLPYELRKALVNATSRERHTVSVAVRGWLAQVPWDSLALDDAGDLRLVERATVLAGLAATLHVGRARLPDLTASGPVLRVVDPGPPGSLTEGRLCADGDTDLWWERCADDEEIHPAEAGGLDHAELGRLLRTGRPARLVYYGHARSGTAEAPASASLLLCDAAGQADRFTAFRWLQEPAEYPAPPRVALIACASDDSEQNEQSGMPVAAINAGAELVTATRWTLPVQRGRSADCPTMALALAVDAAHGGPDPLGALRTWQLERLRDWRAGGAVRDTPLLWSALVNYLAPGRPET